MSLSPLSPTLAVVVLYVQSIGTKEWREVSSKALLPLPCVHCVRSLLIVCIVCVGVPFCVVWLHG